MKHGVHMPWVKINSINLIILKKKLIFNCNFQALHIWGGGVKD